MNERSPQHVVLVVHALHGGGAERIAATMANHWARSARVVTVVTLDSVDSDQYPVDAVVRRVGLNLMGTSWHAVQALRRNWQRVTRLRAAIRQARPACVVSLTDRMNVLTLLACRSDSVPVIIAEHSDPRHQQLPRAWEWLRGRTYPHCAAAVTLTRPVADFVRLRWRVPVVHVIPNGIALPPDAQPVPFGCRDRTILGLGRLSHEKGFDMLIDAFAGIAATYPDWQLVILGEGPERPALEARIADLGMEQRVQLRGWCARPLDELGRAGLFALPSRYEGFPVGLLEALACGLPAVCFACDSGPAEIVRPDIDGVLVPPLDREALAAELSRLIREPARRAAMAARAPEVLERFGQPAFLQRWDRVLEQAIRPTGV